MIAGAVILNNDTSPIEMEGNTITSSTMIQHTTVEFAGNAVGGSLLCSNGGSLTSSGTEADAEGTPTANQVRGADTCQSPE